MFRVVFGASADASSGALGSLTTTLGALTLTATGTAPVDPHAYFEALLDRGDFWKAYSWRPVPGDTDPTSPYWEKQLLSTAAGGLQQVVDAANALGFAYDAVEDAATLTMPPFLIFDDNVLAADPGAASSGDTTVLQCTDVAPGFYTVNIHIKLDAEVCKITARDGTLDTITVLRGQQGTSAVGHAIGTRTLRITNSTPSELVVPLTTAGELTKFFFTWDAKYGDSHVGTGLTNHKAYQVESGASGVWMQPSTAYVPSTPAYGSFNPLTDVCGMQVRGLTGQFATPTTAVDPLEPITTTFAVKPNVWTRHFLLVDMRAISDPANYFDCGADLSGALNGTDTSFSVITTGLSAEVAWFVNRHYIQIDDEIMALTASATSGNPRTLTVTRGAKGTSAATHASGAAIKVCANALVSLWLADETRDAVEHIAGLRMATLGSSVLSQEASLANFVYEFNTSNDNYVARSNRDLVSQHRNWAALKSPTLDPVGEGLLQRPLSGEVPESNRLAVTLGALTLSATGTVAVQGTLSKTLGALTLAGTGAVAREGTLTRTLGALTLNGSGLVSDGPLVIGDADVTLGALSLVGTGTVVDAVLVPVRVGGGRVLAVAE